MQPQNNFQITSPAFANGAAIPLQYTCKGAGLIPPLQFQGVPEATAALALIMHDPDSSSGDFLHWTIWNMSPALDKLEEDAFPDGVVQGMNDFGQIGYGGPCPHTGTHRYIFDLYALGTRLDLAAGAKRADLLQAMQGNILAQASFAGFFGAGQTNQ